MKHIKLYGQTGFALVSDEDYERLSQSKWANDGGYVTRRRYRGSRERVYMHHEVVGYPAAGFEVDHIDRNRKNNQRDNLRIVTHGANMQNVATKSSTGYRGVSFCTKTCKWRAAIKFQGKTIHLGGFKLIEDAAKAYDKAAVEYFGNRAQTNYKNAGH